MVSDLDIDLYGDGSTVLTFSPTILTGNAAGDTTAPELSIDAPSDGQAVVGTFNANWTASDAGSGINLTLAKVEGGGISQTLSAPGSVALESGLYTMTAFAEDRAGNLSTQERAISADGFEWLSPLQPDGSIKVSDGDVTPLEFRVATPDGAFAMDESVTVDVISGNGSTILGPFGFAGSPNSGVVFQDNVYQINLPTSDLAHGQYRLRVRFDSPDLVGEVQSDLQVDGDESTLTLCGSYWNGTLSVASSTGGCPSNALALEFPTTGTVTLCINRYTSQLTWSPRESCSIWSTIARHARRWTARLL